MKITLRGPLLSRLIFGLLLAVQLSVAAQPEPQKFELKDGDRVVFLGNSLFENDLQYGYLEMALTTRWPDRNLTFRNLGWTGDTVFGESRKYITNPPTPYELLLQQLTDAKPTVVFVAYGGIEAQAGQDGLPRFTEGLNKLLDKIAELGAKAVLLSPIPVLAVNALPNTAERNAMLMRYAMVIANTAAERGTRYVDIFSPIQQVAEKATITDNSIHLNENGYYFLTNTVLKALNLTEPSQDISISVSRKGGATSNSARILAPVTESAVLGFELDQNTLPLPPPVLKSTSEDLKQVLKINGLEKGTYALYSNGTLVAVGTAGNWADGVLLRQGPLMTQAIALQKTIIDKNLTFFHQYRPQNRTYIIGFRSYEQGRHAKDLSELSIVITWLESQIALNRMPVAQRYELTKVER